MSVSLFSPDLTIFVYQIKCDVIFGSFRIACFAEARQAAEPSSLPETSLAAKHILPPEVNQAAGQLLPPEASQAAEQLSPPNKKQKIRKLLSRQSSYKSTCGKQWLYT